MTTLKRAIKKFMAHQCTDLAAALTYYSVLAIFPAALALLSLIGVVSDPETALEKVFAVLGPLVSDSTLESVRPTLESMARSEAASVTLVIGLLLAVWSASGYVGAFSRAMNHIREVEETRPIWKLKPLLFLITLVAIVLCAAALLIIVVSGDLARAIGDVVGLGRETVELWDLVKWPGLAVVVVAIVTLLQRATPNCRRLKFHWITLGAFLSILLWLVASAGFAFYVANFGSYDKTYGSVAGVIVALLWLWLTNLALLFGAEVDAQIDARELERREQAEQGVPFPGRGSDEEAPSVMSGPDEAHFEDDGATAVKRQ